MLGVLLEEVLSWVRTLPGSQRLRALIVFDEVYGFLPPHPQNPPTKRPLVALMKQARAFGVGVLVATQNPMDLDYRALSNAGLWCVGRLQTDADRARVVEGLSSAGAQGGHSSGELTGVLKQLEPRWFLVRDAHDKEGTSFLTPKLQIFREFRVFLKQSGYRKSYILRYLEEALAETYGQLRAHGLGTEQLVKGIKFPLGTKSEVTIAQLGAEARGILMGPITVGGMVFNVFEGESTEAYEQAP